MKKYKTKKHLSLNITENEKWSENHRKQVRTYRNTNNNWRNELDKLNNDKRMQKLFQYSFEGNKKMVKALLNGAGEDFDLNYKDTDGNTALMYAIKGGNIETIKYLIERGAEINYINNLEISPLHLAVRKNRFDIVSALVDFGALLNIRGKFGETPIFDAVGEGNAKMVEALHLNGALINVKNNKGDTPLLVAVKSPKSQDCALTLLSLGASVEEENNNGQTPLIYSIHHKNNMMIDILLKRGADMNHADAFGNTPIMYCAKTGNREALRVLIARGADFTRKNKDGKDALEIAKESGFNGCAEILAKARRIIESNIAPKAKEQALKEFATHNKITNSCAR